jgi:hypothetical protein
VEPWFLKLCGPCGRKVAEDDFSLHQRSCVREQPAQDAAGSSALPYDSEAAAAAALFRFWETEARFSSPDLYSTLVREVLEGCAPPGRRYGFSLRGILRLASAECDGLFLPRVSAVVRKCKTVVEGRRLQTTYVHILKWLGVELAGAAMCGRLTDLQFAQRRDLLTELVADAGERQLVMRPDGTWFACRPELEGILWKYYASEARIALLNFLARAESRVSPGSPLPAGGSDVPSPEWVRNFLALELFLRQGISAGAVLRGTLGEFQGRGAWRCGEPRKGRLPAEPGVSWTVEACSGERLVADARLGRALEGYVRSFRKLLLNPKPKLSAGGGGEAGLPLFPAQGGGTMRSLVPSLQMFFAMAGELPQGRGLKRLSHEELRDELLGSEI